MEMMKLPQQNDGRRRSSQRGVGGGGQERKTDDATYLESLQHEKLGSWHREMAGSYGKEVTGRWQWGSLRSSRFAVVLGSVSSSAHKLPSK